MNRKIYVDRIFPLLKKTEYKKIMIDEESLMYVTNYKDSERICNIICNHLQKIKDPSESVIVDGTGGIGGDTITFAKKFMNVISIELDDTRYGFLKNNIKIYELKNVTDIKGNSIDIIEKLPNFDVIYLDPPWGGREYKLHDSLRLHMNGIEIEEILANFLKDENLCVPKLIALKLPKNYDIKYLYDKIKSDEINIYLYELYKMYIIVIENFVITENETVDI